MQPIDKFQWNNKNKEKELLEYISILENIFIPDFDFVDEDPFCYYNISVVEKEEKSPEEWGILRWFLLMRSFLIILLRKSSMNHHFYSLA